MKITKVEGFYKTDGIEDKTKPYHFVVFKPFGTFRQKLNTILKYIHHKIIDYEGELFIIPTKSREKYITKLSGFVKRNKNCLIIYTYGNKIGHGYTNKLGHKKRTDVDKYGQKITRINNKGKTEVVAFKQVSIFYYFLTDKKMTVENLIYYAVENAIKSHTEYQVKFSDESEPWPLYAISFKFEK